MLNPIKVLVCFFSLTIACCQAVISQELMVAPDGYVQYKLSNLRVERGILGEVVAIDYRRTQEGRGRHNVQLAARTDDGRVGIMGFSTIDDSGTIRLEDQFPGLARAMGRPERGMEFYFVVNPSGGAGFYDPIVARMFSDKEYLVSNVIRRGTLNSRVSARQPTKEEKAAAERQRKASLPPEELPEGYLRGTEGTVLVVGAPVKIGQAGQWQDATVAGLPTPQTVKVKVQNSNYLRTVARKDWIALSKETAKRIAESPTEFAEDFRKLDIRTLPNGNLVLENGVVPLEDPMSLLEGTPLLRERASKWQDVHLLSSDNVSARVLVNQFNKLKIEIVPSQELAIRQHTLDDLKKPNAAEVFSVNVEGYEKQIAGLGKFPGKSGTNRPPSDATNVLPKATGLEGPPNAPIRTWSDASGKFTVEAELVDKDEENVTLKRPSGKIAKVPIAKLSEVDQQYLGDLEKDLENPFAALVENSTTGMNPGKRDRLDDAIPPSSSVDNWDYRSPLQVVSKVTDLGWGPKSIAISPDQKYVVVGRGGSEVSLCDLESGRILMSSGRMDHMGDVTAARYTPNGDFLVLGGQKGTVEVYAVADGGKLDLKVQFAGHTKEVSCIAFSKDSKYALTGGDDREARYWEVATGRQIASVTGFDGKVKATCVRPSGSELLATDGKTLVIFDLGRMKARRKLEVGRSPHNQSAALAPSGLLLALNDGYKIVLWNLEDYLQMPTIEGTDIPWVLSFASDNQHLFSGHNGVLNVWDIKTGSRVISNTVGSYFNVQALGVSYDGSTVACSSAFAEVTVLKAKPNE